AIHGRSKHEKEGQKDEADQQEREGGDMGRRHEEPQGGAASTQNKESPPRKPAARDILFLDGFVEPDRRNALEPLLALARLNGSQCRSRILLCRLPLTRRMNTAVPATGNA